MGKLTGDAGALSKQTALRLSKRLVVRGWKGRVVVQKWPRPRGSNRTPLENAWVEWFSAANRELKSPHPIELESAESLAKGSGWYYRDVLVDAARGKLIQYQEEKRVTTPTVGLCQTSQKTAPSSTLFDLIPDALKWDNNQFWSAVLNPERITFKAPGLYIVGASVEFYNNTSGWRAIELWANDTDLLCGVRGTADRVAPFSTLIAPWYFHADDYATLKMFVNVSNVPYKMITFWAVGITPETIV